MLFALLIVPYGIETVLQYALQALPCLLIVPYGIETKTQDRRKSLKSLLIVPYGIETQATWLQEQIDNYF